MTNTSYSCPHCGRQMSKWVSPVESDWAGETKYVCFHDECPYYVRGWAWMMEKYGTRCSYRHSLNPETGSSGPLPVCSPDHLRPGIVE
ncbi:MAG: ogr/Delta-like zinc finger family protein [bacterium]